MSDYYTREFDTFSAPPRKDHLFLWTVFILLLVAFAMACWLGSFYIFGHPENARSYKILMKLHKLDPPKRFELTAAPPGEFLTAQKLYERYNDYAPLRLQAENDELLRMYIQNYQGTKKLVPYIIGRYTIVDSRALGPGDVFTSGVAAVAAAPDFPQVLLEHVYPSDPKTVPALQGMLTTGLDLKLAKTLDLAAVIHIERLANGDLQFTAVPLLYGSYALKQGAGTFALEPPQSINLAPGLPIIRGPELEQGMAAYADYQQKNTPASSALDQPLATASASATPSSSSELVRLHSDIAAEIAVPMRTPKQKGHGSPAPMASAAAIALASPATHPIAANQGASIGQAVPTPPGAPTPVPIPETTLAMEARESNPRAYSTPVEAKAVPFETPVAHMRGANGVPLTPFLQSAPAPVLTNNDATWRTYAPGQMPRGRVIEPTEAAPLADTGVGSERLYLRGSFVVTASEENRAVLRPTAGEIGSTADAARTRIIVQYPSGMAPPVEGSNFARDETRPFMVTDVRRGADGQIDMYVREVTVPQ